MKELLGKLYENYIDFTYEEGVLKIGSIDKETIYYKDLKYVGQDRYFYSVEEVINYFKNKEKVAIEKAKKNINNRLLYYNLKRKKRSVLIMNKVDIEDYSPNKLQERVIDIDDVEIKEEIDKMKNKNKLVADLLEIDTFSDADFNIIKRIVKLENTRRRLEKLRKFLGIK